MAVPRITKEDLKARLEGDPATLPVILDARLKYPYEHSTLTLPGAVRVDPDALDTSGLSTGRDVVAYDSDLEELVSARVAAALIRQGYRASALKGGLPEWVTAKFPTDAKDAPMQAPPKAGELK
ncbi:MAG: rhodanese-like domain-containing protein [Acidobacteriota bacterium]|nr:rhodanese-like domain-containing protein [Acidobacteriota bacterium]